MFLFYCKDVIKVVPTKYNKINTIKLIKYKYFYIRPILNLNYKRPLSSTIGLSTMKLTERSKLVGTYMKRSF